MSETPIKSTDDVYRFVDRLRQECLKGRAEGLSDELDAALHLGSSGLEILGAVRQVLVRNGDTIQRLLGPTGQTESKEIIAFVDRAFGR
jgi:hypothetical protein